MILAPRPNKGPGSRRTVRGEDPLIVQAAKDNNIAAAQAALLLDPQSINARDRHDHETALHIAIRRGNYSMVAWLVEQDGIELRAPNSDGRDAVELALSSGHPKIIDMLLRLRAEEVGLIVGPRTMPGFDID